MEELLQVETAGEHVLPYTGYIEVQIRLPEMDNTYPALILVVPDTTYHHDTPILLGTNVIRSILDQIKEDTPLKKTLSTPWLTVKKSIRVQEQNIRRHKGEIGIVKVKSRNNITIQSNQTVTIEGKPKTAFCGRQVAMVTRLSNSILPPGVEVSPALVRTKGVIPVTLSNLSLETVVLPPSAAICQLQEVEVEDLAYLDGLPEVDTKPVLDMDLQETEQNLTAEEYRKFKDKLISWESLFATSDTELGHTDAVQHRIKLTNEVPIKQRFRRIPPGMLKEIQQHLKQMLSAGVIRESHSPWAANIVPVRKKDGKLRMCIDYRQLNKRTIKDAYALPRIDDILDILNGKKWFSVIDLKAGYWQVDVAEEDRGYTAFSVGPFGLYECCRLPFGLSNSPATFQRLMQEVLGDLNMQCSTVYLDDIIIFSDSFEDHLRHMELVFARLRKFGLKLNPAKCKFFQRKVKYLGHIISAEGVEADTDKTRTLQNWKVPSNVEELRSFLGFTGYFRKFVKDYAKIARCLNDLLVGNGRPSNRKSRKKQKSAVEWKWDEEHQEAYDTLIAKLMSPPVMAYPDFSLPFIVHTDASYSGLGAVLYQKQQGKERVIAYASRGLKSSERNYPAHKLEFLALKWSVTDKFKDLLYGHRFEVITDNNPLTYVLTTAKLDATGHRWLAELASFDFDIKYRPGKKNTDADTLSRLPAQKEDEYEVITSDIIKAIDHGQEADSVIDAISMNARVADYLPEESPEEDLQSSCQHWRREQQKDPAIRTVLSRMNQVCKIYKGDEDGVRLLWKEQQKLLVKRGVLYRKREDNGEEVHQIVLPAHCRSQAMKGLHDDVGHPGTDRTLSLLKERFYWPLMEKDVREKINSCSRCILRKSKGQTAPLVNITSTQPMELVCIDFLTIEPSKGGIENVLVITDHFTRYAQAFPTANQSARTTAKVLFENFIVHYGFPARIHSDQGRNFEGQIITQLCHLAGIEKSRTTPYHPMGNGMVERFNRTLLGMLGTLSSDQKADWKSYVRPLVHAYNSTKHESTGFSPFYLMFGRQSRLAIDVTMSVPRDTGKEENYTKFIADLEDRLEYSYKLACRNAEKSSAKQKKHYDRTVRNTQLEPGDQVLVKKTAFQGKHKLANRWESEPYIVVSRPNPDVPVYRLRREDGTRERMLHRNLLLPIGSLSFEESQQHIPTSVRRKKRVVAEHNFKEEGKRDDSESSGSESDLAEYEKPRRGREPEEPEAPPEELVVPLEEPVATPEEQVTPPEEAEEETEEIQESEDSDAGMEDTAILGTERELEVQEDTTDEAPGSGPSPQLRRSGRKTRVPEKYGDYVMEHRVLEHKSVGVKPVPKPRRSVITEPESNRSGGQDMSQVLSVFLAMQKEQCELQRQILSLYNQS